MENSHKGTVKISEADLARFLIFFAGLWFKTNQYLKAGRALLAAIYLKLVSSLRGARQVQLEENDLKPSLRNPMDLVVTARRVFSRITSFDVPPFILKIIKEMEKEANDLLTYYLLVIQPEEEPCG